MKFFTSPAAVLTLFVTLQLQAQNINNKPANLSKAKNDFIQSQDYLSKTNLKSYTTSTDSLIGFNEAIIRADFRKKKYDENEYSFYLNIQKRKYIKTKYGLSSSLIASTTTTRNKQLGGSAVINGTPCVNEGFESTIAGAYTASNSITGWTLTSGYNYGDCAQAWTGGSSEFSIVSTPISDPNIGTIPHSPLGGARVAQLNDYSAGTTDVTRLSTMFPVTAANTLFQFAYAGYWETGLHLCCEEASFDILLKDCSGNLLTCSSPVVRPYSFNCGTGVTNYTNTTTGVSWTNWQQKSIDLSPYIGTCVTIEVIVSDCSAGGHYGYLYFDAACGSQFSSPSGSSLGGQINMCSGSSYATIQAPIGYSTYSWLAPSSSTLSAAQASTSVLSLTNAIAGTTYTVYYGMPSGCTFSAAYTLVNSSVGISSVGISPSCLLGTSGSATVLAGGSGSGYTYVWTNSTNSVVSTSSVVSNLPAGNYSITINAIGSPSCGISTRTLAIGVAPLALKHTLKNYCGVESILSPALTGTNYQWYSPGSAISSTLGGTSPAYTVSPITTNTLYYLSYTTFQGCKDSIEFILVPQPSGSIAVSNPIPACGFSPGGGNAVISLTATPSATLIQNSFSIFSIGSTPSYSSAISTSTLSTFTATNLSGGTYSIVANDGLCKYSATLSVAFRPSANFSVSPLTQSVCSGATAQASVSIPTSIPLSLYTYSWSPSTFVSNGSYPLASFTPTVPAGTSATLIYTVIVTPTAAACPETKTVSFFVVSLPPPIINPIPQLCLNSHAYTIGVSPTGGYFSFTSAVSLTGVINPSLASVGTHSFVYVINAGTCTAMSSGTFNIGATPTLNLSGATSVCEGQSTTLLAGGANTYIWNNTTTSPFITVSPTTTSTYTLAGFNSVTSCSNSAYITVTVVPLPNITILGDTVICAGQSTTLNASGANSYLWNNGTTSSGIVVSPTSTSIYSVQGTNASGLCSGNQAITVSVSNCVDTAIVTGIQKLTRVNGLIIYPNPTHGKFVIETKDDAEFILIDCLGKIIIEEKIKKGITTVDLGAFADGLYILKTYCNKEVFITKLVKKE